MAAEEAERKDPEIPSIPLIYDKDDSEPSALRLLYALYPEWEALPGKVRIKQFTGGVMNTLLKLDKESSDSSSPDAQNEAVLLRAYGGSDILVDRELEARTHTLLTQWGLAAPLLARFENGLLYRFTPGRVCSPQDLGREPIWRAVASKIGEWHACPTLPKQEPGKERNLWTILQQWIAALPASKPKDAEKKEALSKGLRDAMAELGQAVVEDRESLVLCHCDLLAGNVIASESKEEHAPTINFIDYEYAMPAPAAYDLANHLSEWGGFECDYTMLPTRRQGRLFVEQYLESYGSHARSKKIPRIEDLLAEIDGYRGIPGLYWGIHALIQADAEEGGGFDWAAYAEVRLAEFWGWRGEVDRTRVKSGKEISLREEQWAREG